MNLWVDANSSIRLKIEGRSAEQLAIMKHRSNWADNMWKAKIDIDLGNVSTLRFLRRLSGFVSTRNLLITSLWLISMKWLFQIRNQEEILRVPSYSGELVKIHVYQMKPKFVLMLERKIYVLRNNESSIFIHKDTDWN